MALVSHEKIHFSFSAAFPSRLRPVEPRCASWASINILIRKMSFIPVLTSCVVVITVFNKCQTILQPLADVCKNAHKAGSGMERILNREFSKITHACKHHLE